jgi:hypothetical protein
MKTTNLSFKLYAFREAHAKNLKPVQIRGHAPDHHLGQRLGSHRPGDRAPD